MPTADELDPTTTEIESEELADVSTETDSDGTDDSIEAEPDWTDAEGNAVPDDADTPTEPDRPAGIVADEQGRWRNPDGTFATKQPNAEALASVKAEVAAQQAPPTASNTPWTPNIYGKQTPLIEGALYREGHGVFIPEAKLGELTALVARGTKFNEVKQTRQELAAARTQHEAQMTFVRDQHKQILDATVNNPDWVMLAATDPQTAQLKRDLLLEAAELDYRRQFGDAPKTTAPKTDATAQAVDIDPYDAERGFRASIDGVLREAGIAEQATPRDRQQIEQYLISLGANQWERDGADDYRIDLTPIRAAVGVFADTLRQRSATQAKPKAEIASRRNTAAVPAKPTGTAAVKPKAAPTKPAQTAAFTGNPWEDPSKSREERRDLYYKLALNMPAPS